MKLLIIAGPYEADRIRKAALSAGFETVAVEPGESLSGWITASRPDLIVMASQIVAAEPAMALAKVRAVPRGRVPIFLVGDAADEARQRELADGFFVRPIAPDLLLERARAILQPPLGQPDGARRRKNSSLDVERTEMGIGPLEEGRKRKNSSPDMERTEMGLGPAGDPPPAPASGGSAPPPVAAGRPKSGPHPPRPAGATLRPLVAAALSGAPFSSPRGAADPDALLAELGKGIDALLDAELSAALAVAPKVDATPRLMPKQKWVPNDATPAVRGDFAAEATKKVEPALLAIAKQAEGGRARLMARYAPVENGDYFAVLDVPRDATPDDLRRAHDRVLRETSPDVIDPAVARELAVEIDAIRTVAAEALRILGDESLRRRYASRMPK